MMDTTASFADRNAIASRINACAFFVFVIRTVYAILEIAFAESVLCTG